MEEKTKRFFEVLDFLKVSGYKLSKQSSLVTQQKLTNARKGRNNISTDIVMELCRLYEQVNPDYILTGKGSMLTTGGNVSKDFTNTSGSGSATVITGNDAVVNMSAEAKPMKLEHVVYAPLVSQYAYAGYLSGYADEEYIENLPVVPFIADHEAKGNYVAFEVRGDSMDNGTEEGYMEGDRLLGREIPPDLWVSSKLHIRKWDFIIVHTEGILIKRIIAHDVDKHLITIHSLNDMYEDKVLDLKDVRKIFNVIELQRPKRR